MLTNSDLNLYSEDIGDALKAISKINFDDIVIKNVGLFVKISDAQPSFALKDIVIQHDPSVTQPTSKKLLQIHADSDDHKVVFHDGYFYFGQSSTSGFLSLFQIQIELKTQKGFQLSEDESGNKNFSSVSQSLLVLAPLFKYHHLLEQRSYEQHETELLAHKLTKSEETLDVYNDIINHISDALFLHDSDKRFLKVNEQAILATGYSGTELLNMTVKDIDYSFGGNIDLQNYVKQQLKPGNPITIKSHHKNKNGQIYPVRVTLSILPNDNTLALVKDISEEEKMQQELKRAQDFFQKIVESSPNVIYVYDFENDSILKGVNQLSRLLGLEKAFKNNYQGFLSLVHPDDAYSIKQREKDLFDPNISIVKSTFRLKGLNNKWYWIQSRSNVIERTDDGIPLIEVGSFADITEYKELQQKLISSKTRYKALIDNAFDAIALFDKNMQTAYATKAAYRIVQFEENDFDSYPIERFIPASSLKKFKDAWKAVQENPTEPFVIDEMELLTYSGGLKWAKMILTNYLDDKSIEGVIINFTDITREKNAEALAMKKDRYYTALAEKGFGSAALYDREGYMLFHSENTKFLLGYESSDDMPNHAAEFVYEDDLDIPLNVWKELIHHPGKTVRLKPYRLYKKDRSVIWIENTLTNLLDDPSVGGIVSNFSDITHLLNMEANLDKISNYDLLTGLPNRKLFLEQTKIQIARSISKKDHFAIAYFDIVSLNQFNNVHGIDVGDEVILHVAKSLQKYMLPTDYLAKTGDDEFAIIFTDQNTYEISRHCQLIFDEFSHLISANQLKLKVNVKAGIAVFPKDAADENGLMSNAEIALKRAKESNENFAFYQNHDTNLTRYKLALEKDLHEAIRSKSLKLAYQPIIENKTGRLISFEALVRWNHHERGDVSPEMFVKLAEDTDLIIPLTDWVIDSAIQQLANWNDKGLHTKLTINLSPRDISRSNTANSILEKLEAYQVSGEQLAIEITESKEIDELEYSIAQMLELREAGVLIILDDFGTGFSSISHLKKLPLNAVKIDKSFVVQDHDDGSRGASKEFLTGIVNLVQSSDLITIIEGIEAPEHYQLVNDIDNLRLQGFLFSNAVFDEQAEVLIKQGYINIEQSIADFSN